MGNAPAILIFKGKSDILEELTEKERAELLTALFMYGDGKQPPKLTKTASIIFKLIKSEIDDNEKKYNEKLEKNRKRVEESRQRTKANQTASTPKTSEITKDKQTNTKPPTSENEGKFKVKQGNVTESQARFLTEFEERYPNKAINCKISDYPDVNLDSLMYAIKQSPQFLGKMDNLDLQWMLEHSKEIIANKYIQEHKKRTSQTQPSTLRKYKPEELNLALQSVEDIEL